MNVIGKHANTRYYFVPQDGTLFKISGNDRRESFDELRRKTTEFIFKCVVARDVRHLKATGRVVRELELI